MNILNEIVCSECKTNKKLKKQNKILLCKKCGEHFPILQNIPIMLTKSGDFFHVKKALLPAKYRVKKYGN